MDALGSARSLKRQILVPFALGVTALGVTVGGVSTMLTRSAAGQELEERAASVKQAFEQALDRRADGLKRTAAGAPERGAPGARDVTPVSRGSAAAAKLPFARTLARRARSGRPASGLGLSKRGDLILVAAAPVRRAEGGPGVGLAAETIDGAFLRRIARPLGAKLSITASGAPGGTGAPTSAPEAGEGFRTYVHPLGLARGAGSGKLLVGLPSGSLEEATRSAVLTSAAAGISTGILLVLLLGLLLDRAVATPLRGLGAAIRQVRAGNYAVHAEASGASELREVVDGFNRMATVVAEHQARLEAPAGTDPLTGVATHGRFQEALGVEVKRAQRDRTTTALVVLDIDDFKSINDTHGHSHGDELLRAIARNLTETLRATDLVARIEGDQFAVVLQAADPDLAAVAADRACAAAAAAAPKGFSVTCSAGIACFPDDAGDASTLLQSAAGALAWAKRSGRGLARRYDEAHVSVSSTEEERAEVAALLKRPNPITAVFQPLVSLSTGRILGYEALARFNAPPKRAPDAWFAQAQRSGLGSKLEAAAIEAALAAPGRPPGTFLSLNLSPSALVSGEVQSALPIDLSEIVIEMTEHEFVEDEAALLAGLAVLRERGARIAVDDAGAGYAGLQQVMRLQPDVIKLDRSLIEGVNADPAKAALIDSFVRFGRRTGSSICAEGIETLDELKVLADLDVTYGQGYVLARPAEPWTAISPFVAEALLRRSLVSHGDEAADPDIAGHGDRRLEHVSAQLSAVRSLKDLDGVLDLIAAELGADEVCLSRSMPEHGCIETVTALPWLPAGERFPLKSYATTKHVLTRQEATQVLISDPGADLGELSLLGRSGHRSLLIVPVASRGAALGVLHAFSRAERPWARTETNRARIIAYQLGSVAGNLWRADGPPATHA